MYTLGQFKITRGTCSDYQAYYKGPSDQDFRPLCHINRVANASDGKWVGVDGQRRTPPCKTRADAARHLLGELQDEESARIEEEVANGWRKMQAETPAQADTMTEYEALVVYELLTQKCRAPASYRGAFVYQQAREKVTEWRFQGILGFGGKFYRNAMKWYVSAYPEDTGPEARLIIAETNRDLLNLYRRYRSRDFHDL